jgi:hypothetical protein
MHLCVMTDVMVLSGTLMTNDVADLVIPLLIAQLHVFRDPSKSTLAVQNYIMQTLERVSVETHRAALPDSEADYPVQLLKNLDALAGKIGEPQWEHYEWTAQESATMLNLVAQRFHIDDNSKEWKAASAVTRDHVREEILNAKHLAVWEIGKRMDAFSDLLRQAHSLVSYLRVKDTERAGLIPDVKAMSYLVSMSTDTVSALAKADREDRVNKGSGLRIRLRHATALVEEKLHACLSLVAARFAQRQRGVIVAENIEVINTLAARIKTIVPKRLDAQGVSQKAEIDHIRVAAYTGDLSQTQRDRAQRRFNNGELDVIIISKAGTVGLNFFGAKYLVHYQVSFTTADNLQASARILRGDPPQAAAAAPAARPAPVNIITFFLCPRWLTAKYKLLLETGFALGWPLCTPAKIAEFPNFAYDHAAPDENLASDLWSWLIAVQKGLTIDLFTEVFINRARR